MLSLSIYYDLLQALIDETKVVRVFPAREAYVLSVQEQKPYQNEIQVQASCEEHANREKEEYPMHLRRKQGPLK